jgi:RNA polymerase sigma factor (sigma-70 family)
MHGGSNGSRRQAPKFATIRPVLESSRELLPDGRQPGGGSQGPGKGALEQVYLDHLATIRKAAAHACRRYGFSREEVEDFTQKVELKIWADGCAVLRKHEGRSKLATYLVVVVHRALQDHVDHLWGKWRPSAEAKRRGALAVQLEKLLVRDRYSFSQACQILRDRGVTATEAELGEIAAHLPQQVPRRLDRWNAEGGAATGVPGGWQEGGSQQPREAVAGETADGRLWSKEWAARKQKAYQALGAALETLPAEERLIVERLREGCSIVQVARSLHLDPTRLYKQRNKIMKTLRLAMERAGISAGDVAEILDRADT